MKVKYQSGQQVANEMKRSDWLWTSGVEENDVSHLDEATQLELKSDLDKAVMHICQEYGL
jgi:hypothetical protein